MREMSGPIASKHKSYFREILRDAWAQSCDLVAGSKAKTIFIGICIAAGTVWIQRQFMHEDTIHSLEAGIVSLVIAFGIVFAFHFCYLTPKAAWTQLREQLKGKAIREVVKKLVDETQEGESYYGGKVSTFQYRRDMIMRMIAASDDFGCEEDVEEVCRVLDEAGHVDPFAMLEERYGTGFFKGKRLKLLQDARISQYELHDHGSVERYIDSGWGKQ